MAPALAGSLQDQANLMASPAPATLVPTGVLLAVCAWRGRFGSLQDPQIPGPAGERLRGQALKSQLGNLQTLAIEQQANSDRCCKTFDCGKADFWCHLCNLASPMGKVCSPIDNQQAHCYCEILGSPCASLCHVAGIYVHW